MKARGPVPGSALLVASAVGLAALILLLVVVVRAAPHAGSDLLNLSAHDVEELVNSWGMWGVAASMLLMVLHSFIPVPAEVIAIANGMCFGPLWGTIVTWSGAMCGAIAAFVVARLLGRPFVCRFVAEERRARLERWSGSAGTLLVLRLIPLVSFNLVNYAAGVAGTSWWTFLWTTALGILPLTVLTAILGARMFDITWQEWAAIGVAIILVWLGAQRLRIAWIGRS